MSLGSGFCKWNQPRSILFLAGRPVNPWCLILDLESERWDGNFDSSAHSPSDFEQIIQPLWAPPHRAKQCRNLALSCGLGLQCIVGATFRTSSSCHIPFPPRNFKLGTVLCEESRSVLNLIERWPLSTIADLIYKPSYMCPLLNGGNFRVDISALSDYSRCCSCLAPHLNEHITLRAVF